MAGATIDREDKKDFITLRIKRQDGNEVLYRIKRDVQLKKLMNAYCDREKVDLGTFVFLFDGDHIQPDHTPKQLKMEDDDEIDAFLHQHGGGAGTLWI